MSTMTDPEIPNPEHNHHDIPHNPLLKWVGHFFVGLGFVGIVVPIMPGTVFFIIAAYFYARSSKKFYNWLMDHKFIGPHIKNYQAGKITFKGKLISIGSMTFAVLMSIFLIKPPIWVTITLLVTNLAVAIYILRFRTA
jgi:uncharacterized protein